MVGVLITIGTITSAPTELMVWEYKMPKDLEIKLTLLRNVEDNMKDFRLSLSKIANDYSKALRDNDVDMQRRLIKYAKNKHGITKETLDGIDKKLSKTIGEAMAAWDKVFSKNLSDEYDKQYKAELARLYRVKETELNNLLEQEKSGVLVTKYNKSELKELIKEAREELAILDKLIDESNKTLLEL